MATPLPPEVERFRSYLLSVRSGETATMYANRAVPLLYKFLKERGFSLEYAHRLLLQDFVAWMVQVRKLNPVTVKPMVAGALKFIEFRRDEGTSIPEIKRPDLPRIPKGTTPPLLRDDVMLAAYLRGLVQAGIEEPLLTLLRVLPFCGLRISEAVNLKLDDILVSRRPPGFPEWILVRVRKGKGGKSREAALLPGGLVALRYYAPELVAPESGKIGWRSHRDGPWLWPSRGKPSSARFQHVHRITVEAAVKRVRPYVGAAITPRALRRTYGTMLARAGVPMKVAQDYMGHESILTTAKYYTFLEQEDRLRLMDKGFAKENDDE